MELLLFNVPYEVNVFCFEWKNTDHWCPHTIGPEAHIETISKHSIWNRWVLLLAPLFDTFYKRFHGLRILWRPSLRICPSSASNSGHYEWNYNFTTRLGSSLTHGSILDRLLSGVSRSHHSVCSWGSKQGHLPLCTHLLASPTTIVCNYCAYEITIFLPTSYCRWNNLFWLTFCRLCLALDSDGTFPPAFEIHPERLFVFGC